MLTLLSTAVEAKGGARGGGGGGRGGGAHGGSGSEASGRLYDGTCAPAMLVGALVWLFFVAA